MELKNYYKQRLLEQLDENFKNRLIPTLLATGIGAAAGAVGGVAAPYVSDAKQAVHSVTSPDGGATERTLQGVRSKIGLGSNSPASTRAGVGSAAGAALGLAGLLARRRRK